MLTITYNPVFMFLRIINVINSCQTADQLETAFVYMQLGKRFINNVEYDELRNYYTRRRIALLLSTSTADGPMMAAVK